MSALLGEDPHIREFLSVEIVDYYRGRDKRSCRPKTYRPDRSEAGNPIFPAEFFQLILGPFLPAVRWVWNIISWCFTEVKSVVCYICSIIFSILMRCFVGPTIETIIGVIANCLYLGYLAVKKCFVFLATLLFTDLFKLATYVIAKYNEMGISKMIYDWVVGTVTNITGKIFNYLSGNEDLKKILVQVITGARDFILGIITGSVSGVTGSLSSKIKDTLFFWRKESNADETLTAEDHHDEEVVETVAEVSADKTLLNALPDNFQESAIKEAVEEPDSVQAKLKSSAKQKSSRNSPTKKTQ